MAGDAEGRGEPAIRPGTGPARDATVPIRAPGAHSSEPRLRWSRAPRERSLTMGEVQIRAAVLDRSDTARRALGRHLSADELRRLARLRRPLDQARSLVCRGLLRELLSDHLEVPPGEVSFRYGEHGKPALAGEQAQSGIRFNVSHSGALALFAFALDVEVGVDVEARRPLPDLMEVATRFFSESEVRSLLDLPSRRRQAGFYNAWTRKEAFVKAMGDGLTHSLSDFDVTLKPGDPVRLLRLAGDRELRVRWSLEHLEPAPGFVGAVALPAPHMRVRCWS